jgi:hypothetical protein
LCYYSSGGFPFKDVYDLPVEKRKFFLRLLQSAKESERDAVNSAKTKSKTTTSYPSPERFNGVNYNIPKK